MFRFAFLCFDKVPQDKYLLWYVAETLFKKSADEQSMWS